MKKIFLQIVQWQIELPLRDAHDFFSLVYPNGHMNLNGKWLSEGKCKKAHSFLWFDFPIILIRYWNPSERFHLSRVEKIVFFCHCNGIKLEPDVLFQWLIFFLVFDSVDKFSFFFICLLKFNLQVLFLNILFHKWSQWLYV